MPVPTVDELEQIFELVNKHNIKVLQIGDIKVVRGSSPSPVPVATNNHQPTPVRRDDVEDLLNWVEGTDDGGRR